MNMGVRMNRRRDRLLLGSVKILRVRYVKKPRDRARGDRQCVFATNAARIDACRGKKFPEIGRFPGRLRSLHDCRRVATAFLPFIMVVPDSWRQCGCGPSFACFSWWDSFHSAYTTAIHGGTRRPCYARCPSSHPTAWPTLRLRPNLFRPRTLLLRTPGLQFAHLRGQNSLPPGNHRCHLVQQPISPTTPSRASVEGSGTTVSTRSLPETASVESHPAIVPLVLGPNVPVIVWASMSVYEPGPKPYDGLKLNSENC
jgi:hypothetical protein